MAGRQRELETVISVYNKQFDKMIKVLDEYPIGLAERLDEIGKEVIADWYADYPDPVMYRRQRGMYSAYKISTKGMAVNVEFDSAFMERFSYDVDTEYIFENSFMEGYHGGATSGEKHPNPGVPYWRKPIPYFRYWGKPAVRSFSPYEEMIIRMQDEIDRSEAQLREDLYEIVDRLRRTVLAYLRK